MARNATVCYILGCQVADRAKVLELNGGREALRLAGGPMGLPDSGIRLCFWCCETCGVFIFGS